jgi:hypothetical protein
LLLFNVLYKDIERDIYIIVWVSCFSIDSQPETVLALFLKKRHKMNSLFSDKYTLLKI